MHDHSKKAIIEKIENRISWPKDVHGEQLRTQEYGTGRREIAVEIWERPPYQSRLEVLSFETIREFDSEPLAEKIPNLDQLNRGGHLIIRNGTVMIKYDRESKQYHKIQSDSADDIAGSIITPAVIGSHLYTDFEMDYRGKDSIIDRTSHIIIFRPKNDADSFHQQYHKVKLWVDDEYWLPLKFEAEYQTQKDVYRESNEFTEIEFNSDIDECIFEFDPPEGAEKVN